MKKMGTEQHTLINERIAVRAVILYQNKLLLIHSNLGDYKFPGGGVEDNENHKEALIREIREESGYIHCIVKDKLGTIVERKIDDYNSEAIFQMTSHYYVCELFSEEKVNQKLDDYEFEQDFTPVWMPIDEAIKQNERVLESLGKNDWVKRETFVLKEIKKMNGA